MAKYTRWLSFLLLACIALTVIAAPIEDLSRTSIELESEHQNFNDEHLTVTVTRVDDLVSDEGSLVAERILAVKMKFEVEGDKVLVNGVHCPIGVSSVQIEAGIGIASDASIDFTATSDEITLLDSAFDIGLVTVEVTAAVEYLPKPEGENDVAPIRRVLIMERVTEINGETVVQTTAGQQVLDVYNDGSCRKYTVDQAEANGLILPGPVIQEDMPMESLLPSGELDALPPLIMDVPTEDVAPCAGAQVIEDLKTAAKEVAMWWNEQSQFVKAAISGAFGCVLFGIFLFIRHMIRRKRAAQTLLQGQVYDIVATDEADIPPPNYMEKDADVIVEAPKDTSTSEENEEAEPDEKQRLL